MLSRKDRSSLAGEFYTLAELYRRGYNAFITLGKAKQIDIIVKKSSVSLSIEVKTRMSGGQFLCQYPKKDDIQKVWCFVDLYKKGSGQPDFYILSAKDLIEIHKKRRAFIKKQEEYGKKYSPFSRLDVTLDTLKKYKDNWSLIESKLK